MGKRKASGGSKTSDLDPLDSTFSFNKEIFEPKTKKKRSSGRFSADAKKKTSLEQKNKNKRRKQNTKKVVRDDGLRGYYTQADSPWSVIEADVADMSYVQNTTFLEDFRDGRDLKYNEEIVKDHQYRYLLVVVDVYSSYVFVEPLINKDADSMVNAMKRILSKQNYFKPSGYTRLFSSDRGGEFLNKKLRSLMDKKSYLMTQRENHAQFAEVKIRDIKKNLAKYFRDIEFSIEKNADKKKKFINKLPSNYWLYALERYINFSNEKKINATTGYIPADLFNEGEFSPLLTLLSHKNRQIYYNKIYNRSMKHEMSQKEVLNYNIKIGDKVRIAIPEKEDTSRINNFFVKKSLLSSSNDGQWSNSIYIVYDIWEQQNKDQPIGAPFVYRVKNINTENILKHTFSRAQILLVNKNDLVSRGQKDQPEESKRIERKIRK